MPIAGIIRRSVSPDDSADVDRMLAAMRQSPQMSTGRLAVEECGLVAGWVHHAGAFADCMPLVGRDESTVLLFDGEVFTDATSDAAGKVIDSTRATYLRDVFARCGDRAIAVLNGWFAGLFVDKRTGRIVLFTDRYRMRRVYYHATPDEFLFASEAKALLTIRPGLRRMHVASLAALLRYNCVLGDDTLFKDVSLLPEAAAWTFERTPSPRKATYFRFSEWEQQSTVDPDDFYPRWADTISQVVPRYTHEGVNVGLSMTAGLDTRLIMAALGRATSAHPSYTFGGAWGELFDVRVARHAASIHRQTFDTVRITDEFLARFGEYATRAVFVSDGTHDACGAHDIFFNERARQIAPIRLTGKFGSEIVRTRPLIASTAYGNKVLVPELNRLVADLPTFKESRREVHPLTRVLLDEIAGHEYARVAVEQSQLALRTPYMDNDLVKLMYQAPLAIRNAGDLQERYVKERAPEFATFVTNMGRFLGPPWISRLAYYPFWILFKVEYIYLYATPHWMTRADRSLDWVRAERLFSGRQKWEGYRIWMKTHFSEFLRDTLLNRQAAYTAYFDFATLSQMVSRHLAGTHNYLHEINKALTVQLICTSLIEGP